MYNDRNVAVTKSIFQSSDWRVIHACKLAASRTELLRKTAVRKQACRAVGCLLECRYGEASNGTHPLRRQGSAASKHDTCSYTMGTVLAATAVVVCTLNAGESERVLTAKQRGRGR